MRRLIAWAMGLALAALSACAPAVPADGKTLRVAIATLPPAFGNPHSGTNMPTIVTWAAIFDTLTYVDAKGALQPWLALSWRAEGEGAWVFELRPGVTFSNGEPFDAEAVVATVAYLTSDAAKAESVAQEIRSVASARALGPLTVEIATRTPDPILPRTLATMRIVAPKAWASLGRDGFARAPVGTGPFMLASPGDLQPNGVMLTAFKASWRPPLAERLYLAAIPDETARLQALLSGAVDVALGIGPENKPVVEAKGGRLVSFPGPNVMVIAFVTVKPGPLQDVRVRRALNYAVGKQVLVDALYGGATTVATQPAPPQAAGFDASIAPYPHDPDKARALLKEAGYENGFDLTVEAVTGGVTEAAMYAAVASDLAKVGVRMTTLSIPTPQLIRYIQTGGFKGQAFGMDYGTAPSLDALRALRLHSCQWRVPWNCDQAIMPLIEAAQREFDPARRLEKQHEVMRAWHDSAPAIFLFNLLGSAAHGPGVSGLQVENNFIRYDLIALPARQGS
jgi:peptide/nickel transport system substrate-binding protein